MEQVRHSNQRFGENYMKGVNQWLKNLNNIYALLTNCKHGRQTILNVLGLYLCVKGINYDINGERDEHV